MNGCVRNRDAKQAQGQVMCPLPFSMRTLRLTVKMISDETNESSLTEQ